jgi:hypothetical protein
MRERRKERKRQTKKKDRQKGIERTKTKFMNKNTNCPVANTY